MLPARVPPGPTVDPRTGAITFRVEAPHGLIPERVWFHLRDFGADRTFRRDGEQWVARIPAPPVDRLEYLIEVRRPDGGLELVCDPANPARVPGVFGDKSELTLPGYRRPAWLDAPTAGGVVVDAGGTPAAVGDAAEASTAAAAGVASGRDVVAGVDLDGAWSLASGFEFGAPSATGVPGISVAGLLLAPPDSTRHESLPLLLAHDGPEYARLASLLRYLAGIRTDTPALRCRVALLQPIDRDRSYSASPGYARDVATRLLPGIRSEFATRGPVVGMGASLGGLAMLHLAVTHPGSVGMVFSQSGSFFRRDTDHMELGFRHFDRIADFVATVRDQPTQVEGVRLAMTCGTGEENLASNRLLHRALVRAGVSCTLTENADGHSYAGWRDCLEPTLAGLLLEAWGESVGQRAAGSRQRAAG